MSSAKSFNQTIYLAIIRMMRQQATLSFVSLQPASLPQTIMQRIGRWSDLGLPAIITEI